MVDIDSNEESNDSQEDYGEENESEQPTYFAKDVEDDMNEHRQLQEELRKVSFGALADAQNAIGRERPRKHISHSTEGSVSAEKLRSIRDRLAELRGSKLRGSRNRDRSRAALDADEAEAASSDQRTSKHAPTEMSSKRPVTRKRTAVEVAKNPTHARDPRFSAALGVLNEDKVQKNYAFLRDYQQAEVADLSEAIHKTKNEREREKFKKERLAIESRLRQSAEQDREKAVQQQHRKKEKELIKQGKKPFYLKQSEQRRQALVAKYEGMKSKERAKVMERRRKKVSQREKRNMPAERRAMAG